ncbi:glycoside hydrolase domain-containing protein [Actinocrispum sp. NPDC049592]|uniref:glycoside hydrolase domain-containing protein n=1 Tax=Actinocrispum sp. NPDC049592 TaxID=3154835 RepID=UPI0034170EC0
MIDSTRRAVTALAVLLAAGGAVPAAAAAAHTITYHGYQVDVPAGWRVVDLTANPSACVRFDTETVYLGHQSARPDCPAKLAGRTAGLVVEPIADIPPEQVPGRITTADPGTATPPADIESRDGTIQLSVEDAGVLVTAAHSGDNEPAVREILASAKLVPGGQHAELTPPAKRRSLAPVVAPGTFKGKGFDVCSAPSQSTMDAWRSSPYDAVGIYSSGGLRACGQPNLTSAWVSNQAGKGWKFILIDVGRQAPCTDFRLKMSTDPATARQQGRDAANAAISANTALGFGSGSAVYSDIEGYSNTAACRASVLSYVSGWTEALHAKGWLSGVYSSGASGIKDLANAYNNTAYTRPDHIWFAWWNNVADADAGTYAPDNYWANHQRIHQYSGEVPETWGGVRLSGIDRNYLDVGSGTPNPCDAVNLTLSSYPKLELNATGAAVKAAQCLLDTAPSGTFDDATSNLVRTRQQSVGLPVTGVVDSRTWTALLSAGSTPTVKDGSTGDAVERLQRSLIAALGTSLDVDGIFGPATEQAVRQYQTSRGLGVDGIVGPATWTALQAGK